MNPPPRSSTARPPSGPEPSHSFSYPLGCLASAESATGTQPLWTEATKDGPAPARTLTGVRCDYFERDVCRSCSWLPLSYDDQLDDKLAAARALLPEPREGWLAPVRSPRERFRNKAKVSVGGTVDAPLLGIPSLAGPVGAVTDLAACPLHVEPIEAALGTLRSFVTRATLVPYDVATRRGELKHLLVTANPRGELMVRFVLRSREAETRIRKHLPDLLAELPGLRVVSLNLLPEHAALTEGAQEIVLVGDTLTMPVDDLDFHLRPRSFFQTNTGVAAALYRRAAAWVGELAPRSLWDLYCGVGGFALSAARAVPGLDVLGVEISDEAIASARRSAADLGLDNARFEVGDATTVDGSGTRRGEVGRDEADTTGGAAGRTTSGAPAGDADSSGPDVAPTPDVVVVNPPRRGIGPDLAAWLERGRAEAVLYSSCNPTTLARDLAAMPSLRLERAQLLDMFPNTPHSEVLTLLRRV